MEPVGGEAAHHLIAPDAHAAVVERIRTFGDEGDIQGALGGSDAELSLSLDLRKIMRGGAAWPSSTVVASVSIIFVPPPPPLFA